MTLIWLKRPVLWHSSRVPSGYNYTAMTPEQIVLLQSRWHFLRQNERVSNTVQKIPFYRKIVAVSRSTGAKQVYIPFVKYYSPPLSAVIIVIGFIVFFAALTLGPHLYLWPNIAMGHSPPIATRSGWISIAILPFLLAFATKVNFIGMVTGVSHEKLQVYHRWTAWIMYVTSLIHTFPFIVQSIRLGEMEKNWQTTSWYWTGVAALVPQTWLVFMSWGPIRNRYYETFKKLHFIASVLFVVFLFIHCSFRLTSWDYFAVSAVLYCLSWLTRVGRTLFNGLGAEATFEDLPENMVKITIPTTLTWRPGQNFFVRFLDLGIHAASSHPFTVATLPEATKGADADGGKPSGGSVIEMYARVHGGITARLAAVANTGTLRTSRVLLDGPYGGLEANFQVYDKVLLLAGGSGVTFVVPLLLDVVRSFKPGQTACRTVCVVWAVRTTDALSWFDEVLSNAVSAAPEGLVVNIAYYVTDVPAAIEDDSVSSKSGKDANTHSTITRHSGRPDLPTIVKEFCADKGTVAVATCGPESFNYDVGGAVSEQELAILAGKSVCSEVYLHSESYSW